MAIVRASLKDILARPPQADWAKVDATTEQDLRRHMVEDGEDPDADLPNEQASSPAVLRAHLGMTQVAFARLLRIPVATLRNWEQGRNAIDPAARSLLMLIARDPRGMLAALRALRQPSRRATAAE